MSLFVSFLIIQKKKISYYGDSTSVMRMLGNDLINLVKIESISILETIENFEIHKNDFYNLNQKDRMKLGALLYEFLINHKILQKENESGIRDFHKLTKGRFDIKTKNYCRYNYEKPLEDSLLKLKLPMICKPNTWVFTKEKNDSKYSSNVRKGGFLTKKGKHFTMDLHCVYTSKNPKNYYNNLAQKW